MGGACRLPPQRRAACFWLLLLLVLARAGSCCLLAGQISAFRVSWIARLRLSLINALTSARVWNGDSVKGAVECSWVNFYGDLNRSMRVSRVSLFPLILSLFFIMYGLNQLSSSVCFAANFSLQVKRDTRYVQNCRLSNTFEYCIQWIHKFIYLKINKLHISWITYNLKKQNGSDCYLSITLVIISFYQKYDKSETILPIEKYYQLKTMNACWK